MGSRERKAEGTEKVMKKRTATRTCFENSSLQKNIDRFGIVGNIDSKEEKQWKLIKVRRKYNFFSSLQCLMIVQILYYFSRETLESSKE